MRYANFLVLILAFFLCASAKANPNVGETTVDYLMSQGSCAEAIEFAKPAAERGEPWAQYRMGMILLDERCPSTRSNTSLDWLMKAATFQAESGWEKGDALSFLGSTGYFNARESATNAAIALGDLFTASGYPAMKWYWLKRALSQYASNDSEYEKLSSVVNALEKSVSAEAQAKISQHWDSKEPWHKQLKPKSPSDEKQ